MDRIAEIRQILAERAGELTDTEIAELQAELHTLADERLDQEQPTDQDLEDLDAIAELLEGLTNEVAARETAAAERAERAAELNRRIRGEAADGDGGDDGEGGDAPVAEEETEPVAAAATPARPRIANVNARRPRSVTPAPTPAVSGNVADWGLVAGANAPGTPAGSPIRDERQLAEVFLQGWGAFDGAHEGAPRKVMLASKRATYSADRTLDDSIEGNLRKLNALTSTQALAASGGVCAPTEVHYDLPIVGTAQRPVRDEMMLRMGAGRGGVRLINPPTLTDVSAGVGVWTNTTDTTPGGNTKSFATVTCPSPTETFVEAIYRALRYGNFRANFFPEQIAAWAELQMTAHARFAETRLLTAIGTGSKQLAVGQILGTARDLLTNLDRIVSRFRNYHRAPNTTFRLGLPHWVKDQIRSDIARQMPVGTVDETLALADAEIERWIAVRNVNVTWFLDGESGQLLQAQNDQAAVNGWPSTVYAYIYPEGTWVFLDGGQLDLGLVRDSTLNSTNDVQTFFETFEASAFHGIESYRVNMDFCPQGTYSAPAAITPCTTGS